MGRSFDSLASFGRFLGDLTLAATPTLAAGVTAMAENLHREVREIIGDPDKLKPRLSLTTVQLRAERKWGYSKSSPAAGVGPDNTLKWTGELQESYEMESAGLIAGVGSASDKAVWHEVGTAKIPARKPLATAAQEAAPGNAVLLKATVERIIGVRGYTTKSGRVVLPSQRILKSQVLKELP